MNCAFQRGEIGGDETVPSDDALVGGMLMAEFQHHIRSLMEGLSKGAKKSKGGKSMRHRGRRGRRR